MNTTPLSPAQEASLQAYWEMLARYYGRGPLVALKLPGYGSWNRACLTGKGE